MAVRDILPKPADTLGALIECVVGSKTVQRGVSETDGFRDILKLVTSDKSSNQPFICVSLVGRQERCVGVIVPDNKFLWNEAQID